MNLDKTKQIWNRYLSKFLTMWLIFCVTSNFSNRNKAAEKQSLRLGITTVFYSTLFNTTFQDSTNVFRNICVSEATWKFTGRKSLFKKQLVLVFEIWRALKRADLSCKNA